MSRYLLPFFILVSFSLYAQTNIYHPFPDSGATWVYDQVFCINPNDPNHPCSWQDVHPYYYKLEGDTIIGPLIYHKLHAIDSGAYAAVTMGLLGGLREDSTRRIFFNDFSNPEQLLYDFSSANIGDTLVRGLNDYCKAVILAIDSIQLADGQWRRRFQTTACDWPAQISYVVEGVGSNYDLMRGPVGAEFAGWSLRCLHEEDTLIYIYDTSGTASCYYSYQHMGIDEMSTMDLFSISPNPSSGIFIISSSMKIQYFIYDVFGRVIQESINPAQSATFDLSGEPKGIYFVRGKSGDKIFSRKIVLQ